MAYEIGKGESMRDLLNVVIVIARCHDTRETFGVRFEEKSQHRWVADWAFAIKDAVAKKEGYYQGEISGIFEFETGYPGCPYCHAISIFRCGCGKVACWDGQHRTVTCPWCSTTGELSGTVESLSVRGDY
jgi:hypothetical protein